MKVASGKVTGKAGRVIDGSAMLVAPVMMFVIETVALGRVTTGAEVEVGIVTVTPRVEMVKAGAVTVRAGAVKVANGAVKVPPVVAIRDGNARVWADAVTI